MAVFSQVSFLLFCQPREISQVQVFHTISKPLFLIVEQEH